MRAFYLNGGISQNNLLISISAHTANDLKAIALNLTLFASLFTRAGTLIITFFFQSFWFTDYTNTMLVTLVNKVHRTYALTKLAKYGLRGIRKKQAIASGTAPKSNR